MVARRRQRARLVDFLHGSCNVFRDLSRRTVEDLVDRHIPTSTSQTLLLHYIQHHPDFAFSGDAYMPRVGQRFLHAAEREGLQSFVAPRCMNCDEARLLTKTLGDGRRVCVRCEIAAGQRICDGCGNRRSIADNRHGESLCSTCWRRRPQARKICISCGRPGLIQERTPAGLICARCATGTVRDCAGCGQEKKICGYLLGDPQCQRCYNRIRHVPGTCRHCRELRIIAYLDATGGACCAGCAGVPARFACRDCGSEIGLMGLLCARCTLEQRSLALITRDDGTVNEVFQPARDYLLASPRTRTLATWVHRSASAALIRDLVNDRIPLNHDSLDNDARARVVDHVRHLLVTVGLLPVRDERLVRAGRRVENVIAAAAAEHQQLLRRYSGWGIISDLRRRSAQAPLSISAPDRARMKLETADRFLRYLAQAGTDLGSVRQGRLEQFVLDFPAERNALTPFLRWAHNARLLGEVELSSIQPPTPSPGLGRTEFDAAILRLNTDVDLPVRARVAGLLVGLFGQTLTRLVTLTHEDIEEEASVVAIRLGDEPVRLPPALARLTSELRDAPRPWTDGDSNRWLFPSKKPGQAVHPKTLGSQLHRHGFDVAGMRSAAMFNLASQIPIGPLSELTGVGTQALGRWATTSGRDWAAYIPLRTEQ